MIFEIIEKLESFKVISTTALDVGFHEVKFVFIIKFECLKVFNFFILYSVIPYLTHTIKFHVQL